MFGRFAVPRAALRDVPSLRSALGFDVAAPFGATDGVVTGDSALAKLSGTFFRTLPLFPSVISTPFFCAAPGVLRPLSIYCCMRAASFCTVSGLAAATSIVSLKSLFRF